MNPIIRMMEEKTGIPIVFADKSGCAIEDWISSDNSVRAFETPGFTDEGNIIDMRTGEIDPVLTAQYAMGIW